MISFTQYYITLHIADVLRVPIRNHILLISSPPQVSRMVQFNSDTATWVASAILEAPDPARRVTLIARCVIVY